jgi:hypothetical protein
MTGSLFAVGNDRQVPAFDATACGLARMAQKSLSVFSSFLPSSTTPTGMPVPLPE